MSLLMSASPWNNGNIETKKRQSTMRKTLKNRPYISGIGEPDEYVSEELTSQMPPTIQDVQEIHENRSNQVNDLINKITNLSAENDGQHLANFNPMPNPTLNNRKPPLESRNMNGELKASDLLPQNPYQISPPPLGKIEGPTNYGADDSNLGKLSNYNTSYQPSNIVNQPYYAKMGLGNANGGDKFMEKINYMIHLLEEQQNEKTNNVMEEFILYTFLGVFMIYIADSFVRAGRYVR